MKRETKEIILLLIERALLFVIVAGASALLFGALTPAHADTGTINCDKPKPVVTKRKPRAKPLPVKSPLVIEEICPAAGPTPVPPAEPLPPVQAVAEAPSAPDAPTFAGVAASVPEERAAPIGHLVVHDLVPGPTVFFGVAMPGPERITERTVYVDRPVQLPPSFDAPTVGVPVSPVPEPETWALMAAGLALVCWIKRRAAK